MSNENKHNDERLADSQPVRKDIADDTAGQTGEAAQNDASSEQEDVSATGIIDERSEEEKLREQYRLLGAEAPGGEASIEDVLNRMTTFSEIPKEKRYIDAVSKRKSIRRRRLWILILLVLAAIGACVYFFLLRDNGKTDTGRTAQAAYTEADLLEATPEEKQQGKCEYLNESVLYMYAPLEQAQIQSIAWHNTLGDFEVYRKDSGDFVIRDAENVAIDNELFSVMLVAVGKTYVAERVTTAAKDMSEYGLGDTDPTVAFTVTSVQGVTHTIRLGSKIPSNAGYYARYEGRDAVYILSSSYLDVSVMQGAVNLMTPLLVYPVQPNQYYLIDDFILCHDGKPMMQVVYLSEDERESLAITRLFKMIYPADYTLSVDKYDTAVLQQMTELTANYVVAQGLDEATLDKYGCLHPAHEISYTYDGVRVYLMISEKQDDDTYYVASDLMGIIGVVDARVLEFLEWDLSAFVERSIFSRNIKEIDKISLQSADGTTNAMFDLTHLEAKNSNDQSLEVTEQNSHTKIENVQNFRYFYQTLLTTYIEDESPYTEKDIGQLNCELTLTVTTLAGVDVTYRFYPYSTGRVLYTINGRGEFYVKRKQMQKLISDCEKVIAGLTVDPSAKN